MLLDVDNDGFEDTVSFGTTTAVWKNHSGSRFEMHALGIEFVPEPIGAAVALDAEGDGATDLTIVGRRRYLLRGRTSAPHVEVSLASEAGEPIGALVYARYADGHVAVRRYGSAKNTLLSQGLLPLRFGMPKDRALSGFDVRWPGATALRHYPAPTQTGTMVLER